MTFVPIQQATKHAERLLQIFGEIGEKPVVNHGVEAGVLSLWETLEELAHPGDPSDPKVEARHVAGAGIHDLAAKVSAVWDKMPQARDIIEPHLKVLAQTYHVGQNAANPRWDRHRVLGLGIRPPGPGRFVESGCRKVARAASGSSNG